MRPTRPLLPALLTFALLAAIFAVAILPAAPATRLAAQDEPDGMSRLLYSVAPDAPDAALQALVDGLVKDLPGDWGVVVKKLDTGQYAGYRADEQAVSASLYKTFVLWELMRQVRAGQIALDDELTITASAAAFDLSIDDLHFEIGSQEQISWLANRMIDRSDNTAALTLANAVGVDNVNATLRQIGLTHSLLDFQNDNLTTATDMAHLFEMVASGKAVSRASSAYMLDLYLGQELNDLIPVGLPEGTPLAHKTGTLEYLMHDAGIVYGPSGPYILVLLASNLDDYPTAYHNMPIISKAVYEYFNGRYYRPTRYFAQTKEFVGPSFLLYYNTHGGSATFGLPISAEQQQNGIVYQYFERARLERSAHDTSEVVLGRVGSELLKTRGETFEPTAESDPNDENTQWFPETQQAIGQPFLDYWRNNGGTDIFGLPVSGVIEESVDGSSPIKVQYFERARFELHGDDIVLGPVGSELLAAQPPATP